MTDQTFTAIARPNETINQWSNVPKMTKTRIYVSNPTFDWPDFDADDATIKAANRAYIAEARKVAKAVIDFLELDIEKFTWNAKAGCSCGCSPAFIANTRSRHSIFISVK